MTTRAVFGDAEAARTVATRLRADGFEATVVKAPFAGEDDDEDHAWAVSTDAPTVMVELLAEEHEGWWEDDEAAGPSTPPVPPAPSAPPPVELPDGPRRTKGHWPA